MEKQKKISHRKLVVALFLVGMMFIMGVNLAYALDFDNIKSYDSKTKTITIDNAFGLGSTIEELAFKANTDICGEECSAEKEIIIYEDTKLIDSIKFLRLMDDGKWVESSIRDYQFYIKTSEKDTEVNDYSWICNPTGKISINGTAEQSCSNALVGTHIEKEPIWKEYQLGEVLEAGTYYVKLVGHKRPEWTYDWIITSQGKEIDEWAIWGSAQTTYINDEFNSWNSTLWGNNSYWQIQDGHTYTSYTPPAIDKLFYSKLNYSVDYSYSGYIELIANISMGTDYGIIKWDNNIDLAADGTGLTIDDGTSEIELSYLNTSGTTKILGKIDYIDNKYHVYKLVQNATNLYLYVDDVIRMQNVTVNPSTAGAVKVINFRDNMNISAISLISYTPAGSVTLNSPINDYKTVDQTIIFNCSAIPTAPATLVNISLWTNNTGWKINETKTVTGATGSTTFVKTFPAGNYLWGCSACDSDGDCGFSLNRTISVSELYQESINYISNSYITDINNFNTTFIVSARVPTIVYLVYNGTSNITTLTNNGAKNYTSSINKILPSIPATYEFYWSFVFDDGYTFNSTIYYQNASSLIALSSNQTCPSGANTIFNFTFVNEVNKTLNVGSARYNIQYGLSGNPSGQVLNGSVSNITNFAICLNNTAPNYYIGYGEVQYSVSGFADRRFYIFQNTRTTNSTISNNLNSLDSSSATAFQITAQDNFLNAYDNNYVTLLRWYPDDDEYRVVDMGKTDEKGQTLIYVKTNDVDYRMGLYELNGSLIKLIDPLRMVCTSTPCVYNLYVSGSSGDYTTLNDVQYSLTYNNNTSIVTFTWNDATQSTSSMRLVVSKFSSYNDTAVCDSTTNSFTGILTCNLSGRTGVFFANVYRSASPSKPSFFLEIDKRIDRIIDTENGKTIMLLFGIIMVILAGLIGVYSPVISIIIAIFVLVPMGLLGGVTISIIGAFAIMGGIIIHFIKTT